MGIECGLTAAAGSLSFAEERVDLSRGLVGAFSPFFRTLLLQLTLPYQIPSVYQAQENSK